MRYQIVEIFASRQGEGANTGRQAVFLRLAGCNLACSWCDTDCNSHLELELSALLDRVSSFGLDSVIITGGEPLIHPNWVELVQALREKGYWVGLETNATIALDETQRSLFNYIAASPKNRDFALTHADEVRLVVDSNLTIDFCEEVRQKIVATHYYLSPCEQGGTFTWSRTLELLGTLNAKQLHWGLSIQTHKLAGIR